MLTYDAPLYISLLCTEDNYIYYKVRPRHYFLGFKVVERRCYHVWRRERSHCMGGESVATNALTIMGGPVTTNG